MSAPNPSTPEVTRPTPFDLPLHRGDYGDDICDDRGKLVANLYGDERDPKTVAQRDYIVRAVNLHGDMLAALKAARAVLGEAGSGEHVKQLTDVELGKLWLATTAQIDAAIAKAEEK